MLKTHLNAVERSLLEISRVPANSGHSLHKGTPREAFIKEFLSGHLNENVAVGTGEIIDCDSRAGEQRHQIDIVIYNKNYPKINFGGGINAFLAESVIATIEVKSTLNKTGLEQAIGTARTIKSLKRNIKRGPGSTYYRPPAILNYVVAYDGPTKLETVLKWIPDIHEQLNINPFPANWPVRDRFMIPSPSLDGVFVLGKGFLYFDNVPLSITPAVDPSVVPMRWVSVETKENSLYCLFMTLTFLMSGYTAASLNIDSYLTKDIIASQDQITYLEVTA
ncbi:MAG: DUF6602 domain-containing protein [Acidobacteriota bacterium]